MSNVKDIKTRLKTERSVYDAELADDAIAEIESLEEALRYSAAGCAALARVIYREYGRPVPSSLTATNTPDFRTIAKELRHLIGDDHVGVLQ